ncbi:hypothetical protein [Marinitenerispora sediminis]|uniref:Uncharacterized protein n=1 Tax=Marinitenerispora sediminis TaxID=1931232 RepID=A0A368T0Z4_9ACTN|nr:hypothetical protein [Marinitenerispora sediminis]RCV49680.1 hypothetical protein DEF23_23285 [Marinitenerispora sediminis]RCV52152.1 hypothetical protein DEF28_13640 [Marinitenerispora sediminis]RCV53149.1 hypothetical protein DEF24_20990 [Marinitenerispora sediminis]
MDPAAHLNPDSSLDDIRAARDGGARLSDIAERIGRSTSYVSKALNGRLVLRPQTARNAVEPLTSDDIDPDVLRAQLDAGRTPEEIGRELQCRLVTVLNAMRSAGLLSAGAPASADEPAPDGDREPPAVLARGLLPVRS